MRKRQLKRSLAFNFVLAAVIPIVLLSFIVLVHLAKDAQEETERQNQLLARTVSGQVEIFLHEPLSTLGNIAALFKANPSWDAAIVRRTLDLHIRNSDFFESILLLDENGNIGNVGLRNGREDFYDDFVGINLSHLPFYSKAVEQGSPAWSNTFLSVMSGSMSIALCVPVDDRSLIGQLNIDSLSAFVRNLNTDQRIEIALIDRKGNIIVHPDPEVGGTQLNINNLPIIQHGMKGQTETGEFYLNNMKYIGSVQKIAEPDWLVLVSQSVRTAYHRVAATALSFLIVAFAASLLAVLFALVKARRIISPVNEVASQARQIAGGDYDVAFPDAPYAEITELTGSIREMADAVRKRETELQLSHKRFRQIYNATSEAIFIRNAETYQLVDANRAMTDLLGYSLDELKELSITDISAGNPEFVKHKAREMFGRALVEGPQVFEWNYVRKNGEPFWAEVALKEAEIDGKQRILGVIRNITERKMLEHQLLQSQKMEAIGTLAGGIAHDFNNILTPILGYVELAMVHKDDAEELEEDLKEVLRAVHRAKELVQQILTFSRQESQQLSPTSVSIIVKEALKLMRSSIPTTIEIRQDIVPDSGLVLANPTQIHQILINLCTNAYHAMREKGGVLGVSVRPVMITSPDPSFKNLPPGNYLLLEVRDTGHGMDKDILTRILEPYFTTKDKDEGTGLGLSVVHGIVKGLGGELTVDSEIGAGSTFQVYLPVIEGRDAITPAVRREAPPGGNEHILLIDDEEVILRMQKQILSDLGYHVETFISPAAALEYIANPEEPCDLVITDMTMPGMTGDKLTTEMRQFRPDLPVILCTGFSEAISREKALDMGLDDFLVKPVEMHVLAYTVRRVLNRG